MQIRLIEKSHKENVPGSFYVCDGCCTACGVPLSEAPEMFAYDDKEHCYVKQQPQTENELDRMIRTVLSAELECIRYNGEDKAILRRMAEGGAGHLADKGTSDFTPVSRNHVTFDAVHPLDKLLSDTELATEFQNQLQSIENDFVTYKFTPIRSNGEKTNFSYAWFEDNYHPVEISFIGESQTRWLIVSDTLFQIHDWLAAEQRFCNIRWYTEEQWNTSRLWQKTPW